MKNLEKILVIIMLLIMVLPAIQKEYDVFQVKKLDGDFVLADKPVFSWVSWFGGSFQTAYDKYLEDHIGFRDFLVRLTNQIDYSFYRIPHAEGVVVGKADQLIEYDYIRAYTGGDFIGEKTIDRKIRMLKFLQEYLKNEKNIDLVLVFEPGKASFFPECIPDQYLETVSEKTNYDSFLKKANVYDVNFIDFRSYFNSLKGNTKYPLYPRHGIHWSIYGMTYAADSLISYIEDIGQIDLPDYSDDSLQIASSARRPDYDAGRALNLLFKLPEKEDLAYPVYEFVDDNNKEKPMVLVVGDSYYWNIFNTQIPKHLFQNEAFWYFNKQIYPDSYIEPKQVSDIDLKTEIEKQDVILLMITGRFLYKFGWNFIEDVYKFYGPSSEFDKIHDYTCSIANYSDWFNTIIEEAKEKQVSLEEMLYLTAQFAYSQENLHNLIMLKGADYYKELIEHDSAWYNALEAKAIESNMHLGELIQHEADWNFKTKHAEIVPKYNQLEGFKLKIRSDSLLLIQARQYAKKYYLTLEESIQINAETMLNTTN